MPVSHHVAVAPVHAAPVQAHPQPGRTHAHSVPRPGQAADHGKKKSEQGKKKPARVNRTVSVKAGDSVYSIARAQKSSVAAILKANPHLDIRRLMPGTRITVPVSSAKAAASAKPTAKKTKASADRKTQHAPKPKQVIRYTGTSVAHRYPAHVVASGDRHRQELAKANLPTKDQIRSMIEATAKRYGVDPKLALGIAWQESGWQQSAVSVCDAIGTMQVMPETGTWASSLAGRHLDLAHAEDNVTAGVVVLRYLTQHADSKEQAVGAYYQGLHAMKTHGPYPDTRAYIASVKGHMARLTR